MESATDLLEASPLFNKAEEAYHNHTVLTDEFELDGITYCLKGTPTHQPDGSYSVWWSNFDDAKSHSGQQTICGFHDTWEFDSHDFCRICFPQSESAYWLKEERQRQRECLKFQVNSWNPDIVF